MSPLDLSPADLPLKHRLGRLARLSRKELNESLRDRRTILTLVLMPLLLYPVLAAAFQQFLLGSLAEKAGPVYRVGFQSRADAEELMPYLDTGRQAPAQPNPELAPPGRESQPVFKRFGSQDLQADVLQGAIDVGIRPLRSGVARPRRGPGPAGGYELLYREDSAVGRDCVRRLKYLPGTGRASGPAPPGPGPAASAE
jgi:hypothetical protein